MRSCSILTLVLLSESRSRRYSGGQPLLWTDGASSHPTNTVAPPARNKKNTSLRFSCDCNGSPAPLLTTNSPPICHSRSSPPDCHPRPAVFWRVGDLLFSFRSALAAGHSSAPHAI